MRGNMSISIDHGPGFCFERVRIFIGPA